MLFSEIGSQVEPELMALIFVRRRQTIVETEGRGIVYTVTQSQGSLTRGTLQVFAAEDGAPPYSKDLNLTGRRTARSLVS